MMKKSYRGLVWCLLGSTATLFAPGCGSEKPNIVEACHAQTSEDDCVQLGNNILMLSDEAAGYQCVWTGADCVGQLL